MTIPELHQKIKNSKELPSWVLSDLESAMKTEISSMDMSIAHLEALIALEQENEPDWN